MQLNNKQELGVRLANQWWSDSDKRKKPFVVSGSAGCLDKDTLLLTNKGTITLENIILSSRDNLDFTGFEKYLGDLEVYNGKKFTNISDIYATEIVSGYNIVLKTGLSLNCSSIHPLLTIEEGKYKWIESNQLSTGIKVASLGNKFVFNESELKIIEDFYYMGYYIADGYFANNVFSFTSKNKERLDKFTDYIKRRYPDSTFTKMYFRKDKNNYLMRFRSKLFQEFVEPSGLDVKNKLIPINLLDTHNKKFSILSGIFNDLTISKNEIAFSSIHKENTKIVQIILREFGIIFSNLKEKFNKYGSTYQITLVKDSLQQFYNIFGNIYGARANYCIKDILDLQISKIKNTNINVVNNMNIHFNSFDNKDNAINKKTISDYRNGRRNPSYEKLKELNNLYENINLAEIVSDGYFWDEIVSIEPIVQKFYDITVPDGHSFVSNSIISHNSGKTTTVRFIIESLDIQESEVRYCAFTGMASSVLTRKGNPATTLHQLIYKPFVDEKTRKIFFKKKDFIEGTKLVIIDEISQVNKKLMDDLLSFKIPIIAIGDPMQLPQIGGEANNLLDKPDIFLDETVRQALDNPIIRLATDIRNGNTIRQGTMGDKVFIIPRDKVTTENLISAEQIIASKNQTVRSINDNIRYNIHGLESPFPYVGEKVMCLKNNWDKAIYENGIEQFLVNGLLGYVENIYDYDTRLEAFRMDFKPTYMKEKNFGKALADGKYFTDNIRNDEDFYLDEERYKDMLFRRKTWQDTTFGKIDKFTFGYAITAYKSQGSEFQSVIYYDEFMNKATFNKSRYVGVTRAVDQLIFAL